MQNNTISRFKSAHLAVSFILSLSLMTACSFPGVYKINVQQGNIVTQDMLAKLRPGMTKRQVHFVLGTPIVNNVFSDDYESYIYTYLPADSEAQKQVINVYYKNDLYLRHEGEPLDEHSAY